LKVKEKYNEFPAEVYSKTVLAPDFDTYRNVFANELHEINLAQTVMLHKQGLLSHAEASSIAEGLFYIIENHDFDSMKYDGSFEDLFFVIERELAKRIGINVSGKLHTGRSRNDMEHTMFRIVLKKKLIENLELHEHLIQTLIEKSHNNLEEIILLYTHGQPAQPSTMAHYLGAVIEIVLRDMQRITMALKTVDFCPMGAAAITTSGFNLDRQMMAELLGFQDCVENSYGAIAACDYITESYSALKLSCINLGRFVQDLVYWTGFEVSQLYIPDGLVQISSIMPQKRNPVPVEHLRLMLSLASGGAEQIINTMHNTPFADMNDSERETQSTGHQVFERMKRALSLLSGFIEAIEVNRKSVNKRINTSLATITELADSIVRNEEISFRQAHQITHKIAKTSIENNKPLNDFRFEEYCDYFKSEIGKTPKMTSKLFNQISDPKNFISVRTMRGGPSKESMRKSLDKYIGVLEALKKEIIDLKTRSEIASKNCQQSAKKLIDY